MLVLVEGVPGAGKSSTARLLRDALESERRPVRWWYEEETGHPVYCFRDLIELQRVSDDLAAGRWHEVIDRALQQWQRFVDDWKASSVTIILDGCLFGYLTWSLFAAGAPEHQIASYVAAVEQIIHACQPRLIHLRPTALALSMEHVCAARGAEWADRFIENSTSRAYASAHNLQGFAGMVEYWVRYAALADGLFEQLKLPKLATECGGDEWPGAIQAALTFVGADPPRSEPTPSDLAALQGRYVDSSGDARSPCLIELETDGLVAFDLPGLWRRNRLAPTGPVTFSVESLPHRVTFSVDENGRPAILTLAGPDLMFGPPGGTSRLARLADAE